METHDKYTDPSGDGTSEKIPLTHEYFKVVKKAVYNFWPYILPGLIVLLLCFVSFKALQNDLLYNKAGKLLIKNYYHTPDGIIKGEMPYVDFSNYEMLHWDAEIYDKMRRNGYNLQASGGDYIFAFFPLFPALWKLSHLSPSGIALINYLFFIISVAILMKMVHKNKDRHTAGDMALWLSTPMLAVFLIPYTEGLFMLTSTIALYGFYRGRYAVYFPAAFFMAMTRPSILLIAAAIIITEIFVSLKKSRFKDLPLSVTMKLLPVFLGTAAVAVIQFFYGSGSLFKFMEVQKYWNSSLRLPRELTDWAHEQFGSNLALLILAIPVVICLACMFVNVILKAPGNNSIKPSESDITPTGAGIRNNAGCFKEKDPLKYLFMLSLLYFAGTVLSVLFMRGGSLNGLSRYVLCTPFFFIVLTLGSQKLSESGKPLRLIIFLTFFVITVIALSTVNYSRKWDFSDCGFLLLYSQAAFFIFPLLRKSVTFIVIHVAVSALWASYLFNMFLSGVWIFT